MNIEIRILKILEEVGGMLVDERFLFQSVNMDAWSGTGPTTSQQVKDALVRLKSEACVIDVPNPVRGVRWKISDQGRAALREQ